MGRVFVDWELWQQMTFALACAIGIVFIIGFAKLWWTNRYIAKQEIIDAEKRAHTAELESAGLSPPPRKQSDIPFGVRAIQSGIEVDGIWISRPHSEASDVSPVSAKGKGKYVSQVPISPVSVMTDPFASSPPPRESTRPQTYRPQSTHNPVVNRADTLNQLEGSPHAPPVRHTYQPPNSRPGESARPIERESFLTTDPSRAFPLNRRLSHIRKVSASNSQIMTGRGTRAFSGRLELPKSVRGYSHIPQSSPGVEEVSDPFATPPRSQSPVTPPVTEPISPPVPQSPLKFTASDYMTYHDDQIRGSSHLI